MMVWLPCYHPTPTSPFLPLSLVWSTKELVLNQLTVLGHVLGQRLVVSSLTRCCGSRLPSSTGEIQIWISWVGHCPMGNQLVVATSSSYLRPDQPKHWFSISSPAFRADRPPLTLSPLQCIVLTFSLPLSLATNGKDGQMLLPLLNILLLSCPSPLDYWLSHWLLTIAFIHYWPLLLSIDHLFKSKIDSD